MSQVSALVRRLLKRQKTPPPLSLREPVVIRRDGNIVSLVHAYYGRLKVLSEDSAISAHMLDGVSAAVAGFIAVTAVQLLKAAVVAPVDAVVFGAALTILYSSTHRYTAPALVGAAALVGFILVQPGGR